LERGALRGAVVAPLGTATQLNQFDYAMKLEPQLAEAQLLVVQQWAAELLEG
jgi:hypothetical protein